MSYVLNRVGYSGSKLAFLLGCSVVFGNPDNEDPKHQWTKSKKRKGTIPRMINCGCRKKRIPREHSNCFNYNSQFSANKLKAFEAFDKDNIPHPKVIQLEDILNKKDLPEKFLGRINKSSCGDGITLYSPESWHKDNRIDPEKIKLNDFYVQFLECKSEHRIHVFGNEVLCELNKVIKPERKCFIHTLKRGCPLSLGKIQHTKRAEMIDLAIRATKACQLDFAAVDIFVDTNDKVYVLEVNSDPGMPGIIGFLYADKFRKIFNMPPPTHYKVGENGQILAPDGKPFVRKVKEDMKSRGKFNIK